MKTYFICAILIAFSVGCNSEDNSAPKNQDQLRPIQYKPARDLVHLNKITKHKVDSLLNTI